MEKRALAYTLGILALCAEALVISGCRQEVSGGHPGGGDRPVIVDGPSFVQSVTIDGGADAGAGDAGPNCTGAGDPQTGVDGGASCTGAMAPSVFQYALCSCGTIQASGALTTDGFDSTLGGPDGGAGGSVGANGNVSLSKAIAVGGDLWTPGNITASAADVVRGDLHLGGTLTASGSFTVDGNAFSVKALPSGVKVIGTVSHPASVANACDCTDFLPIASMVTAHRPPNNDDATIGLAATAAQGGGVAQIDLPCGNYYLSGITASGALTINAHGKTALYIDGNVATSAGLTFHVDPTATLDLFVSGTFSASGALSLGSTSAPASCRAYVAGSSIALSAGSTIGCNLYAPSAALATSAAMTVSGSVFAKSYAASASTTVHYDTSILRAGSQCCTPSSCDDGNPCTADSCNGDGTCAHTPLANGSSCAGSNQCEQTYACQAGACVGSNPVTCTASDACHVAGTCDPSTGACSNLAAANGTTCSDGNACTQVDTCQSGTCTGSNPVTCTASDPCHTAGTCDPTSGACSNPVATNGTACSDGNACTLGDSCQSGVCTSSSAVVCAASDQCHVAGACDPTSGTCSNPVATNGTSCSDGNACTQTDACQAGTCTGANPVTCAATDACHTAGTCNPATGTCSNPVAANGTACNDGNACTQTDTCQAGTCTGANLVTCTASDACHVAGTCNSSTGTCSNPVAANGTACNDGNACTQTDTCQSGTCTGANPVTCTASDACHSAGTCNPSTGACSNPTAPDGTACTGGNVCNQTYACAGGTCTGSNPVTCTASDACHVAGTCDPTAGCSNPTAPDGTTCNDGNACTQTDACSSGTCTGSNPVACAASDQCHTAGTCDPSSGTCSNPAAANGTACNDGNACTQVDACQSGACVGSSSVVCTAADSCHQAGTCDPTAGTCSNPVAPDGTACSASDVCTTGNTCSSGACEPGTPVNIDDGDACTLDTCDPSNGVVHHACSTLDRTVSTALFTADSFLFSGTAPVQTGVASGTIVPATMAVVQGQVLNKAGSALPAVTVTVVNHPEFGSTVTQGDGTFDMAVNGGQTLRLHYALTDYLPAERLVQAPWQDYVTASDVVLLQVDSQVTAIDLSSSGELQVARATPSTDANGTRQATLLVPPDTTATMTLPDGSTTPLTAMHVRATEYTVGTSGPSAMPATLPPTSAYAYAVELGADEAVSAGATRLTFSQSLPFYLENFLGLPVGTSLPSGSYSPSVGAWVPSGNGIVLEVLSVSGGSASLDVNGDGVADTGSTLAGIGITSFEQQALASLYTAGETLWRVPVGHFTGYAVSPGNGPVAGAPDNACDQSTCTDGNGNDIPCEVGEDVVPCNPGDPCYNNGNYCQSIGIGTSTTGGICEQVSPQYNVYCCPQYYAGLGCPLELCGAIHGGLNTTCSSPPVPPPPDGNGPGSCSQPNSSTIECQRQSLGEDLSLVGTPYTLHYESDRQRGRQATLTIPVSGPALKSTVTGISMQVSLAGRVFTQSFAAQANQSTVFTWDGEDAYGRLLQGAQPITVELTDVYPGVYQNGSAFGVVGTGTPVATSATRQPFLLSEGWTGTIEHWDSLPQGLGGWTLNVHHTYDASGRKLRLGDGTNRTLTELPPVIQTVAGNGQATNSGDGGLATLASISSPQSVAIGPDGSIYIAAAQSCIRKVGSNGIVSTFAGQCNSPGFSGDGGEATSAQLQTPEDIAFGPDGSLFVADAGNQRIRRIDPQGLIHTVAGSGGVGFSGDGGPAIAATFQSPSGVDVAPDGTLYIADSLDYCVRSVSPDGIIRTVAGNRSSTPADSNGNDGPATATSLGLPMKVRAGSDGSLYVAENSGNVVRRVGADGIIRGFAGSALTGYGGDGGPATNASLKGPADLALGRDGTVYILDGNQTVRAVSSRGTISTVVGVAGGTTFSGDNGPAAAATMGNSLGLRAAPDGSLYIACSADNRVRRMQPALPGLATSAFQIPSEDGREVYVFDSNARQQQTLDAFTGAALYQFSYDGSGRLAAVMDVDGNVTQINRDSNGNLTSIVAPFGEQTTFTPDANGYLAIATDPASQETQFTYDANGLMQTKEDPRGEQSQYTYDSLGRLTEDQDPAGGAKTLARTASATGFGVTSTTSLGRKTTYQTATSAAGTFSRQNTLPNGLPSSLQFTPSAVTGVTVPDGTTTTTSAQPDPRLGFGMLSSTPSVVTKTPSGITSTQTTTRSVTLSGSNLATFTEQTNLNGNTWTNLFNASASTWTATSPVGRTTTTTIDAAGRPIQVAVPNVAPFTFAYDSHGRLSTTTQGARTWTQGYDSQGYLASVTDPLSHATSYVNDPVGRPTQTLLADGRLLGTAYDGDSNTTQITLPSGEPHDFTFTPVDLLASYEPPSVSSASPTTQYAYDLDRELKTVTRPDSVTLTYGYDSAGRLQTTTIPQGTVTLAYNASTGNLQSSSAPSGEAIGYTFDGFLKTGETWSGPVAGTLSLGFDNNFRMTSQTVSGTALAFGYDLDGLLTGAGSLTLTRDPQNGRLTGTTLGSVTDSYGYDGDGLFASYTAAFSGTVLYSESVVRDAVGRITQKTEAVQGTTHVWGYTFDPAGRLTDVTEDGNFFSHYGYDADDNRTTYTNTSGTVNPTYDAQDRLTAYGSASYGYTLDGELTSKTVGGQTTSYTYDPLGNLLHVGPPTGSAIDYVVDGENRRVGKKVGGTLSQGFLYQDGLNVVAQLDGSGNLVGRYVFGSKANVPDYFTTSAGTFRILSDHLGSPRLVVNTSSGAVVEEIDYDEFGNVTNDTAPGTLPFGFAGGLYDKDTGLVRFGARDYDASTGRWTSKDPIRFDGGSFNLYGYGLTDPINETDQDGTSVRGCLQALAQLLPAIWKVNQRAAENALCPNPGHDKALDQAKNRLRNALATARRACSDEDIKQLAEFGAEGILAGAEASLLFSMGGGAVLLCCP